MNSAYQNYIEISICNQGAEKNAFWWPVDTDKLLTHFQSKLPTDGVSFGNVGAKTHFYQSPGSKADKKLKPVHIMAYFSYIALILPTVYRLAVMFTTAISMPRPDVIECVHTTYPYIFLEPCFSTFLVERSPKDALQWLEEPLSTYLHKSVRLYCHS